MKSFAAIALTLVLFVPAFAFAADPAPVVNLPVFDLQLSNFFIYQNDRDFDRTQSLYEANGQSIGYFATTFKPGLTWTPIDAVTVRYQAKIGENIWSRNDAEERDSRSAEYQIMQHEEVWGEVRFPHHLGLRAGYQYLSDPTRLFIDRHMGAASFAYAPGGNEIRATLGQLPDSVYEGTTAEPPDNEFNHNNFVNDRFVYALQGRVRAAGWSFAPAAYGLWDHSEVDRPLNLYNLALHVAGPFCPYVRAEFDAALQLGFHQHGGIDNQDEDLLGHAAQATIIADFAHLNLALNALYLSADDGDRNDLRDTGYTYSGWSRSATLMLSQNELEDQYDNLDELVAAQRAGLLLGDLRLGWLPTETVEIFLVSGYGAAVEPANLNDDDAGIGYEQDLGVSWMPYGPHVELVALGGALFPGKSGAAVRNEIDLTATEAVYYTQALMRLAF